MKKSRSVGNAAGSGKPVPGIALSPQPAGQLSGESGPSPERIADGTPNIPPLFDGIRAEDEERHQLRDYGINE
jgi:hypothetical protein